MVDIQTISFAIAGVSVTLAAISYISNLRATNRARQAALFSSMQLRMETPDFWERYIDIVWVYSQMSYEEYREEVLNDKEKSARVMSIISTFYHIGWLVHIGLLDMDAVIGLTFDVVAVYDIVMPRLARFGEEQGQPFNENSYPYFTYLYKEMKKRRDT